MTARAPLPGARGGLAALGLLTIAILTWRFAPTWAGFAASAWALAWMWRAGRAMAGDSRWTEHVAALAVLVAAVLMMSKHEEAWWPCDISCRGGGGYERLLGVLVVKLAFAACLLFYAGVALCGIWGRRRAIDGASRPAPASLQALGWAMIGGSLFYLWTAWRLHMACHQCLAMHTAILAFAGPLRGGSLRGAVRGAAVAVGFAALLAAYGPALRTDLGGADPQGHTVAAPGDNAYRARVDANRSRGPIDAPMVLDLGLEFQCRHCEQEYGELEPALRPLIDGGALRLVVRPVVRPSEAASLDLVRWSLAAAADGERPFRRYLEAMLGTSTGITAAQVLTGPNAEPARLGPLAQEAAAHAAAIARVIDDDRARLIGLGATGAMPFAVLRDRAGAVRGRWSVHIDRDQLLATVAAAKVTP